MTIERMFRTARSFLEPPLAPRGATFGPMCAERNSGRSRSQFIVVWIWPREAADSRIAVNSGERIRDMAAPAMA